MRVNGLPNRKLHGTSQFDLFDKILEDRGFDLAEGLQAAAKLTTARMVLTLAAPLGRGSKRNRLPEVHDTELGVTVMAERHVPGWTVNLQANLTSASTGGCTKLLLHEKLGFRCAMGWTAAPCSHAVWW